MDIERLIRPNILALKPYTCARDEFSGTAEAWLDANENSIINGYNRYPDPLQTKVKESIAGLRGITTDRIFLGVGSDECIDIAYRVFCRPGIDNVVAIEPTYGMYRVCADINDVGYRPVPLTPDFKLRPEAIMEAVDANTRLLWICSPNNPTGNAFPPEQLLSIADKFDGITIIDEAYADFSPMRSLVTETISHPRLIVMQTLSKAWASAAIRLGIAYASPEIIAIYNKVKYPYNINILTQREALNILADRNRIERAVAAIVAGRDRLADELSHLPVIKQIYPSDANFLLVRVDEPDAVYSYLCDQGIIVRNRNNVPLCEGCLRLTIGNERENRMLTDALRAWPKGITRSGIRTRKARVSRNTRETRIDIEIDLDGSGTTTIHTGLGFFDHMLEQIGRHAGIDLMIDTRGDLHVDEHHTIEDTAFALGEALRTALGDKRGIERYGFTLPMDDCLASVAIDLGGRAWLSWDADFRRERIGDVPTEMFRHFFKSLSDAAAINLNIKAEGDNEHHKIEGIFKAFARALKTAIRRDPHCDKLPSTKGTL